MCIFIYTLGNASLPTNLSVECTASSAVVSFQPPVYGAECVDHYIVTAASEERNVTCVIPSNWTLNTYTCNISDTTNVNDYNFTVYGVTNGVDDVIYFGNTTHDCCKLILFLLLALYRSKVRHYQDSKFNDKSCPDDV